MICSASQMDSFWKTFVLSNDCESSIRANVTEPPRFGVAARDPSAAVVQRAETARKIARDRRRVRALTFTPSDGGGGKPVVSCIHHSFRLTMRNSHRDRLR